jgi:hypothetical protein
VRRQDVNSGKLELRAVGEVRSDAVCRIHRKQDWRCDQGLWVGVQTVVSAIEEGGVPQPWIVATFA